MAQKQTGRTNERTVIGLPVRTVVVVTLVALVIAVAAGLIVAISADPADTPTPSDTLTLEPDDSAIGAPAAIGYETFEGETANTGSYVGTPLVLNFFAEWCAPCVAEMPDFEAVHRELGDEVAFLGLNLQETSERALDLIELTGVTYDVGRDTDGSAFAAVGGAGMPTTVFVDAAGTIVEVHTGALTADELRDRIETHFGVRA